MPLIPNVIERTSAGERAYDLYSCLLNSSRTIMLQEEVTDASASTITAQLLYLESVDPDADINLYINSPGGSVSAGLAIYDTMRFIKPKVNTICLGMAASMGAFLLCSGTGERICLPNAEVMIHQPLGGAQGQASDIKIAADHILRTRDRLNRIIAENCGKSVEEVAEATDRDNWLTAEEALAFGLVDKIIEKR